ncbi:E3 SUMO-protein ligase ZBED1 [Sorex araneus]|uniref:E3 SUMO-protein ligase ZBED1 n=1 Tax=Sorex araneus TaxID=42254 RepID=UPI0024339DC5|nr:E3 SUMO-protein ligase ZBED1 [Sorex araneus]
METKAEGCASDLKLVAHPRAKSKVWKYFGFDTNAEGCILQWKKIYCRICMAQIAYSGNTSNLSYHLEKNHPEEFCEFVKSNTEQMREAFASAFSKLKPDATSQQGAAEPLGAATCAPAAAAAASSSTSSSSACSSSSSSSSACAPGTASSASSGGNGGSGGAKAGLDSKRQQELTAAVLGLICEGLYPPSIVDEATFRALLRTAEPRYELPSRKFFCSRALPEQYAAVRARVLRELAAAPWCALSADLWASPSQNRTYVTLAAHFLRAAPSALALGSRCLKTFEVPEDNTAETVTRVLYEAFIEWGIGSKVFGATTDGRKDLVKACALLDIGVHMPCLGQAFQAGIQQAFRLPQLAGLLARCRRLVEYFQRSSVAAYLLFEKQKQQQLAPRMLASNRAAGWGSTLAMLQRLLEHQFAVAAVLLEDSNSHHLMLEAAEWATIEALVELLRPFEQVAELLAASGYPTISMVKPLLHMLLSSTLGAKDTDAKEISMAKEVIAKELAATYQQTPEIDMFLNVATFLDPRYKRLPFLSAFERQQVENRVVEEAKALLEQLKDASSPYAGDKTYPAGAPEDAPPPAKKRALDGSAAAAAGAAAPGSLINNMLAEIFCPTGGVEDDEECHAQVLEELSNFKSQKVLALGEDPLKWWCDRLALFPLLPKVLQKYWCVAATRVPPRRLFGSSATVLGAKRNRLAPAHVHQQVFLYENARAPDAEPEDEDEGEWGLDPEQGLALGDPAHGSFLGIRDGGGGGGGGGGAFL